MFFIKKNSNLILKSLYFSTQTISNNPKMNNAIRLFIGLLFLNITFSSFAQGLNTELGFNYNYHQLPSGVACVNEYSYLVKSQKSSGSFFTQCALLKLDTLGNVLWTVDIMPIFTEYIGVNQLIPTENGGVYVVGNGVQTCDVLIDCYSFIQKYDATGNLEWSTMKPNNCYGQNMTGLSLLSSNSTLVNYVDSSGSHLLQFNPSGIPIDTIPITSCYLQGFSELSNAAIVGFHNDSLFQFDGTGSVINEQLFSTNISSILAVNDTLLVLTQDSIFQFDNNLQALNAETFLGINNYSRLKNLDGIVHFMGETATGIALLKIDNQLQLVNSLPISVDLHPNYYNDFSNSHLSIGDAYPITYYNAIRYLDYSTESTVNELVNWTDIGIVDVQINQQTIIPFPNTNGVYTTNLDVSVLVKNFGTHVLQSCRINHLISPAIVCSDFFYTEEFQNLNLAPGDSMWVNLGWLGDYTNFYQTIVERIVCVYTSHPNQKTDLVVPNDQGCEYVFFGYVGNEEQTLTDFTLFPNPTSESITIQSPFTGQTNYLLKDLNGSVVMNGMLDGSSLTVEQLASGIYFVELFHEEHRSLIKKLVIE